MKKRLVAVLMAMAMCFALVGCGAEDETTEEPSTNVTTEQPVEENNEQNVDNNNTPVEETPTDVNETQAQ